LKKVIALDLGGTKLSAAVVTDQGKVLKTIKEPSHLADGWPGLKQQVLRLCKTLLVEHPSVKAIGVGSAGPLHAEKGVLLDPTNFGWTSKKPIAFREPISKALKLPVVFDNDAVVAVLGEHWMGEASKNSMVVTLGTGVGVGILLNGKVFRGRDGYNSEGGHLILRPQDKDIHCECGADGCAEGVLSGVNFAKWVGRKTGRQGLSAQQITDMAFKRDPEMLKYFEEYAEMMAQFLTGLITLYYPNEIVISGSFAQSHPLFLDKTKSILKKYFKRRDEVVKILPKISISKLNNQDGLLGAAFMAFERKDYYKKYKI